jgi:hypothetical protein
MKMRIFAINPDGSDFRKLTVNSGIDSTHHFLLMVPS